MERLSLPITCDDCGACCQHVGTPPGFFGVFCSNSWDEAFWADTNDYQHWLDMPEPLRAGLRSYYQAMWRKEIPDRTLDGKTPCLWYDAEARRCRHYEHRPQVCREFEVGEEDCLRLRAVEIPA